MPAAPVSPRHTTLRPVADLARFRGVITDLLRSALCQPQQAAETFVLVPSRAAAEQLRRTLEDTLLSDAGDAGFLPSIGPRADWYRALGARLAPAPRMLTAFEREVMLAAGARAAEAAGVCPPFQVRPSLIAEILELYDHVRRLGRSTADFERNLRGELEASADTDRGAAKLLQQTDFLAATFREYESRVAAGLALDEHGLRQRLLEEPARRPITHVIVTIGDRLAEPDGLWPADVDLLTRLSGLARIDIVNTAAVLGSGLLGRLRAALPGMREERLDEPDAHGARPVLEVPRGAGTGLDALAFQSRDREEELAAVARQIKAATRHGTLGPLHRIALVVRRPLPYLYLGREIFGSAGIPFETLDTLPLASEPYAAAVDLLLDSVVENFTRRSLLALLRSPHFRFTGDGTEPSPDSLMALDASLAEARYEGDVEQLEHFGLEWPKAGSSRRREDGRRRDAAHALAVAGEVAGRLRPLGASRPAAIQVDLLLECLRVFDRAPGEPDPHSARRARVRSAVLGVMAALREAYRRHDPGASLDAGSLRAALRRWLGARTFAARSGRPGLQIVDAPAARYGVFDEVQLVGVITGEWPEPVRRSVLYPASLMRLLEPELGTRDEMLRGEREALHAARALFRDLLTLPRHRVRVSSFLLEDEAVVEPSTLLDEIALCRLPIVPAAEPERAHIFLHEAVSIGLPVPRGVPEPAASWARVRLDPERGDRRFRGEAGAWTFPRVSVSRLERYLDCPFRFFASEVLRLEEEPQDEDTRTPLERGRFLHELFEAFFTAWQKGGHRRVTPATLPAARALFEELCSRALEGLPAPEAVLERARLLGSAVSPGIAHRVLSIEAERPVDVEERLLEFPLKGDFTFHAADGRTRTIALSGVADRIDLLADGTLRVIDYKSKQTPDVKQALQLPVYSFCAQERLRGRGGREWRLAEAAYLSFEGDRALIPLRARGSTLGELVERAQDRLLQTLDAVADGHFPPRPARRSLCTSCPYSTVCRLDWVEAEADE